MICPSCNEPIDAEITRMGLGIHPTCPALDGDPEMIVAEAFAAMKADVLDHPRTLQTRIGPSEMGDPCPRRIGHKLAGTPVLSHESVNWKAHVGTLIHSWIADVMAKYEVARYESGLDAETPRFHVEEKVTICTILGQEITGTTDLFDGHFGVVVDWKTSSSNRIRRHFMVEGPGDTYRKQAHLYGLGWENAGHDVKHVVIVWLVRDGQFTERYVWTEPYDRQVALDAVERVETIAIALDTHGPEVVLPMLPAVENHCTTCEFFRRGEDDLTKACPGAASIPQDAVEEVFA
jgi:hypothetical protein